MVDGYKPYIGLYMVKGSLSFFLLFKQIIVTRFDHSCVCNVVYVAVVATLCHCL